jgi:hypothetical protein
VYRNNADNEEFEYEEFDYDPLEDFYDDPHYYADDYWYNEDDSGEVPQQQPISPLPKMENITNDTEVPTSNAETQANDVNVKQETPNEAKFNVQTPNEPQVNAAILTEATTDCVAGHKRKASLQSNVSDNSNSSDHSNDSGQSNQSANSNDSSSSSSSIKSSNSRLLKRRKVELGQVRTDHPMPARKPRKKKEAAMRAPPGDQTPPHHRNIHQWMKMQSPHQWSGVSGADSTSDNIGGAKDPSYSLITAARVMDETIMTDGTVVPDLPPAGLKPLPTPLHDLSTQRRIQIRKHPRAPPNTATFNNGGPVAVQHDPAQVAQPQEAADNIDNAAAANGALPQKQPADHLMAEMLGAFTKAGVPTDMLSGDMNAKIANAVCQILKSTLAYTNDVVVQTQTNAQYLAVENQNLRAQLAETNIAVATLENDFRRFQKRRSQKEISAQMAQIEAKINKLREPDVTLEEMKKKMNDFESKQSNQNKNIESFKESCDKELERIKKARIAFTKDVDARKKNRKTDMDDLEKKVDALENKIINMEAEAARSDLIDDLQWNLEELDERQQLDVNVLRDELNVLKGHIESLSEEDELKEIKQMEFNGAMSATLQHLQGAIAIVGDM